MGRFEVLQAIHAQKEVMLHLQLQWQESLSRTPHLTGTKSVQYVWHMVSFSDVYSFGALSKGDESLEPPGIVDQQRSMRVLLRCAEMASLFWKGHWIAKERCLNVLKIWVEDPQRASDIDEFDACLVHLTRSL